MSRTRRRPIAAIAIVTLLLSLAGHAAAPADSEIFRVVRIKGRRVHLRSGIPAQLTHANVLRHLDSSSVLTADRIGYGIGHDGIGTEAWLHVIDPLTGECGWVNSTYVDMTFRAKSDSEEHDFTTELTAPTPAAGPAPQPESPIHDAPPADAGVEEETAVTSFRKRYGNDLQFLANIAAILALLVSTVMLYQNPTPPVTPVITASRPAAANEQFAPSSDGHASSASRTPNFRYGFANGVPYRVPNHPKS
ncbi:MAG TPA: hypothetical protein VHW00_03140 [Thermoanaerobaculia bacterium]|nr:hypothetical protein [Thermoanaerobaculia bacterium]